MSQTAIESAEARPRGPRFRGLTFERLAAWTLVGGLALYLLYTFIDQPANFLTTTFIGINQGALYALIALGYTLVYGIIELINFSHGDLFMLSTVLSGFLIVNWLGLNSASVKNLILLFLAMIVVMVAASALNAAAERVAYRRLRRAPKLAPLITAVGLSFVYQWAGIKTNGSGQRNWDTILGGGFSIGNVQIQWSTVVVVAFTAPILLLLTYIVQRTKQGKAMRATAQDQDAARLMGINVDRTIALTFAIGGALAGAAGLLFLETFGTTRYDAGFQLGLIAFTAAVLGGIGNLTGAVLGGVLIGLIQAINDRFAFGSEWSTTVVFTILIALMVFKPEGLLGKPTTEKV